LRIGVLALQGDFALHARALEKCGVEAVEVRKPHELGEVDGLIVPGGESTTLLKLMEAWDFVPALEKFHLVLAEHGGEPVMAQQDRVLVATFHPELTNDTTVHEYFCDLVRRARAAA
jgi:5'-phosphate synthase pdxT subunit